MTGKRVNLLVDLADRLEPVAPVPTAQPSTEAKATPKAPKKDAVADNGGAEAPTLKSVPARRSRTFDQFDRKEARLRTEQYQQLTTLSRGLNKKRNREGERITENTLIRVAIDMLLVKQSDLAGVTEDDLRRSVGL